jgi:hypothetical protein
MTPEGVSSSRIRPAESPMRDRPEAQTSTAWISGDLVDSTLAPD